MHDNVAIFVKISVDIGPEQYNFASGKLMRYYSGIFFNSLSLLNELVIQVIIW